MRSTLPCALVALACAFASTSCLEEEAPLLCKRTVPCGGNIVGEWEFLDVCMERVDATGYPKGCEPHSITLESVTGSGSAHYKPDGQRVSNSSRVFTLRIKTPMSCFRNEPHLCRVHGEAYVYEQQLKGLDVFGGCEPRGDVCDCADTYNYVDNGTEPYETKGNILRFPKDGLEREFCVAGNELRLQSRLGDGWSVTSRFTRR